MELFPAIDLRGGSCVRLVEGDFDRETVYDGDPVAVARSFAAAGARWIHIVDLDAARTGQPVNGPVITEISAAVSDQGVQIQAGGGVRRLADAAAYLEAGVARVVLGTAAIENPGLVAEVASAWPGRVAVGLDHRDGEVRIRGWAEGGGRQVSEVVPEVVAAGAVAVIVTDISRDGNLAGPDLKGLADLARTGAPLIASGGVSSLDDIVALAAIEGVVGVIAGKAIYEGRLDVAAAIKALS